MQRLEDTEASRRPSVLVVEDDDDVRDSFRDALEDEGYRVLTARNGFEALHTLKAGPPPSAILLDLMMPGMNGWQFRKAQRREPALADIPVVIVTAGINTDAAARELTPHRCLRKPVSVEELLDALGPICGSA